MPKGTMPPKRKDKRTPAQIKKEQEESAKYFRRMAAMDMIDNESLIEMDKRRGKKIAKEAEKVAEFGGLRGGIQRGVQYLQQRKAKKSGDSTKAEAIRRGRARAKKNREEARKKDFPNRAGSEHMDPYGPIRKIVKEGISSNKKKRGGSVSRKRGGGSVNKAVPKRPSGKGKPYRPRSKPNRKGKIMVGYKAGGKV
jgi:hypothetical protein